MAAQRYFPASRLLKIGYHHYDQRQAGRWIGAQQVPQLRLQGRWMTDAGFAIGERVQLQITERRIAIVPASPQAGWPAWVWNEG
ncbi:MAG: type I addiction module toxin, SymE family [Lysobacter sp.]|nr:MAG: type I addiction module toxin, SymE family [Lysobacter sp.]